MQATLKPFGVIITLDSGKQITVNGSQAAIEELLKLLNIS